MDIACCVAFLLIFLKECLIVIFECLIIFSIIFSERMCKVDLAPTIMTISGSTFHPLLIILSNIDWQFLVFEVIFSNGKWNGVT